MKNKTIIYLVGYDRAFKDAIKTIGWGCGYVMIPKTHPLVINWYANKAKATEDRDDDSSWYDDKYLTPPDANQEITYTEEETVNGIEYIVIGFDTAHGWNRPEHNFNWVFNETIELQNAIDKYGA